MVQSLIGNDSSLDAPTLQFFGISHFKIDELNPLQSAIIEMPFICVVGSLNTTSIQRSSITAASLNCIFGPIFAVNLRLLD